MSKHDVIAGEISDTVNREGLRDSTARTSDLMAILYPHGIIPDQMPDALSILHVLEQLVRIATYRQRGADSPWRRVAAQAIIGAVRDEPGFAFTVAELDRQLQVPR